MTAELINAQELRDAKVRRETYAEIVKLCEGRIADLDGFLAPKTPASQLRALAEALPWRSNSRGEYTFRQNRDGSEMTRVRPLIEAIRNSASETLVLGGFEYGISGTKFLNRRPV